MRSPWDFASSAGPSGGPTGTGSALSARTPLSARAVPERVPGAPGGAGGPHGAALRSESPAAEPGVEDGEHPPPMATGPRGRPGHLRRAGALPGRGDPRPGHTGKREVRSRVRGWHDGSRQRLSPRRNMALEAIDSRGHAGGQGRHVVIAATPPCPVKPRWMRFCTASGIFDRYSPFRDGARDRADRHLPR